MKDVEVTVMVWDYTPLNGHTYIYFFAGVIQSTVLSFGCFYIHTRRHEPQLGSP